MKILFDENVARFIAHVQADGCFSRERNYFRYFNKDLDLIKDFVDSVKMGFSLTCNLSYKGRTCYQIGFRNKSLAPLLGKVSFQSKNWIIPNFILKGSDLIKCSYLQAFFDDESCVTFRKRKEGYDRSIRLQSINKKGLVQLKQVLESLKISSKLYGPIREKYYEIKIMKRMDLTEFNNKISFVNKSKKEKLLNAIKTYQN